MFGNYNKLPIPIFCVLFGSIPLRLILYKIEGFFKISFSLFSRELWWNSLFCWFDFDQIGSNRPSFIFNLYLKINKITMYSVVCRTPVGDDDFFRNPLNYAWVCITPASKSCLPGRPHYNVRWISRVFIWIGWNKLSFMEHKYTITPYHYLE